MCSYLQYSRSLTLGIRAAPDSFRAGPKSWSSEGEMIGSRPKGFSHRTTGAPIQQNDREQTLSPFGAFCEELVQGLPLVLMAAPGSRRNVALFLDRSRPNLVSVAIQDAGSGKFIFKIKVHDAIINSPQNCSPTRLTTSFRLEASSKPPIVISTERSWSCFGPSNRFLKTH